MSADTTLCCRDCIRKLGTASGAEKPYLLNAKNVRSSFATQAQLFALSANEVFVVSRFLGHTGDVNEMHYRKRDPRFDRMVGLVLKSLDNVEKARKNRGKS